MESALVEREPWPFDEFELFRLLNGGSYRELRIATLPPDLAKSIGAWKRDVWLSPATARKQRFRHGDLKLRHYAVIPTILRSPYHYADKERHLVLIHPDPFDERHWLYLVIKATRTGYRVYVVSYRLLDRRHVAKTIKRTPHWQRRWRNWFLGFSIVF